MQEGWAGAGEEASATAGDLPAVYGHLELMSAPPLASSSSFHPPTHTQVSFAYSGKDADCLYRHLELSVDCDSRIALVGPNGAGGWVDGRAGGSFLLSFCFLCPPPGPTERQGEQNPVFCFCPLIWTRLSSKHIDAHYMPILTLASAPPPYPSFLQASRRC